MDSTCSSPESPTTVTLSDAFHGRLGAIMLAECTQRHATSIYMAGACPQFLCTHQLTCLAPFNFLGAVLPLDEKVLGANPRDVYVRADKLGMYPGFLSNVIPLPLTSPAIKIGSAFNLHSRRGVNRSSEFTFQAQGIVGSCPPRGYNERLYQSDIL
jgi:hypothetical protein